MQKFSLVAIKPYLTGRNGLILVVFIMPMVFTLWLFFNDDSDAFQQTAAVDYALFKSSGRCETDKFPGEAGATFGEATQLGYLYNVRAPSNYNATVRHPLIVVYAPAGANRAKTEKMTNLTLAATAMGFIIAYADHPELSPTSTIELGSIAELVANKWCVDQERVFLTGHSDGGTVAMALAFMAGTSHIPSAIAASAAGIGDRDLQGHECPKAISVLIMHSAKDRLFPGYGVESSGWWAACNQCDPIPDQLENGCQAYTGCAEGTRTWYCEGDQSHAKWPAKNKVLLQFLADS